MIQNKVYKIDVEEVAEILQRVQGSVNSYLVEICGNEIQSWEDYINKIEVAFRFPTQCTNNIDGYNDWMRDLDWLGKDSYVLIIHGYKKILKRNPDLKKIIMEDFANLILPWWQEEVESCVVEGKAKSFNVYLVV